MFLLSGRRVKSPTLARHRPNKNNNPTSSKRQITGNGVTQSHRPKAEATAAGLLKGNDMFYTFDSTIHDSMSARTGPCGEPGDALPCGGVIIRERAAHG